MNKMDCQYLNLNLKFAKAILILEIIYLYRMMLRNNWKGKMNYKK